RGVEPSICSARTPRRRRQRAAKKTKAVKISSVIRPDTMTRKMKRASTLPAAVEARSGHNGKLSNISCLTRSRLTRFCLTQASSRRRQFLQPEQNEQKDPQHQNGEAGSQLQNVAHDCAVFPGRSIVVIAIQQHLI